MPFLGHPQSTEVVAAHHQADSIDCHASFRQTDLAEQGWEISEVDLSSGSDGILVDSVSAALTDLQIRQDKFHVLKHLHNRQSVQDGRIYPATEARFMNAYNPYSGTIVAMDNMSPLKRAIQRQIARDQLPALKHWSDVVWLAWLQQCALEKVGTNCLRLVIQYQILNTITLQVIARVLRQREARLHPWPGVTFAAEDEAECQAVSDLLATPLGVGIIRLLQEHEQHLGPKQVLAVRLFDTGTQSEPEPCLAFFISQ